MKVTIVNERREKPCPNCETVSASRYRVEPITGDEIIGCDYCIESIITSLNDGLYGIPEWNKTQDVLDENEFLQVIETKFIRSGRSIRRDATFIRYHEEHYEHAESLVGDELEEIRVGTDDGIAYQPTPKRQLQLINIHDLLNEWDLSQRRINHIKNHIEEALDNPTFH